MKRINITLFTLMLLGILFSCTKASINYTQNGNWVARATWPGTQMGYGVSFVVGNHSYVGLGINPVSPNQRLVAFYQYTPSTFPNPLTNPNNTQYDSAYGVWAQVAPFPGPARSNAVAFAIQTIGYVGSGVGNDGFTPLADFYDYNVAQNTWYQIDSIHDATQSYPRFDAVAWGFDTVGYVLTGTDNNYYFGDVWKYSPQTGHWSQKAYLPGNPRSGAATFVYNGKGYLLTGYTPGSRWAQNNMCYDFWVFDPAKAETDTADAWSRLRDIYNTNAGTYDDGYTNIIRKYGAAFIIRGTQTGDKGYITLGQNGTALTYTWEYDFASDLWNEKTPYEGTARSGAVGFTLTDPTTGQSRGFAGTGLSTGNTSGFSDIEEFFPNQIYNQYD